MLTASAAVASPFVGPKSAENLRHHSKRHRFKISASEFPAFIPKEMESIKDPFARKLASRIERVPVEVKFRGIVQFLADLIYWVFFSFLSIVFVICLFKLLLDLWSVDSTAFSILGSLLLEKNVSFLIFLLLEVLTRRLTLSVHVYITLFREKYLIFILLRWNWMSFLVLVGLFVVLCHFSFTFFFFPFHIQEGFI